MNKSTFDIKSGIETKPVVNSVKELEVEME